MAGQQCRELLVFGVAAVHVGQVFGQVARHRRAGRRRCHPHVQGQTVAVDFAAGDGLGTQQFAQCRDLHAQVAGIDRLIGPDRLQQLLGPQRAAPLSGQQVQHREGAAANGERSAVDQ